MRPGSILGILLELLEELASSGPLPADARVGRFFRSRRYLGARDRRLLSGLAYGWLRHRPRGDARWNGWAARAGLPAAEELGGRTGPLAPLLALGKDGLLPWSLAELLAAARELAPPVSDPWTGLLSRAAEPEALGPLDWPADPLERLAAELSLPVWLAERLHAERGEEEARRLGAALLLEAPLDLRVNLSRVDRPTARRELERELRAGAVEETPWSPLGLRSARRASLSRFQTLHPGWVEVQDEGSQIVALALEPAPGASVLDGCAGAGGKSLALLDLTAKGGGQGRIHAADIHPEKLEELARRARSQGGAVEIHPILAQGPLPPTLPRQVELVLVDAPCSGSGTLRRSPELKYRYGPYEVAGFARLQLEILRRFASRVRPGGRLAYSTCSLLDEENGEVVRAFLKEATDFEPVPSRWAEAHLPPAARRPGPFLRLDPLATGTDGFFLALLERRGGAEIDLAPEGPHPEVPPV